MAKVKYYAKENSSIGTHSFYAVPIPNGTLTFDELLDEAMDGKSVEPSIAKALRLWCVRSVAAPVSTAAGPPLLLCLHPPP